MTEIRKKLLTPQFKRQLKDFFSNMNDSQKKYISTLYNLATHDQKTGLYNHSFFENILDMEMEKARRGQQNLCLFIIDIDFFKKVNDTYGHIKADDLLIRLAGLLKKQLRTSDVVARFGGEEFFILLPETNLEKAKKLTARLRESIKSDKILKRYHLTVSGGLVQYKKGYSPKIFMERADQAMYKAKHTGRDKFVAFE